MSEEEQETKEEEEQEDTTSDDDKGNKPKKTSVLEEANALYEKMGKRLAEYSRENDRREELIAQDLLRGRSSANTEGKKKEESPQEYKDRIMRGEE